MANHTPIATVLSVTGEVYVRNEEGQLRLLEVGDTLNEGDVVIPSESGNLELIMEDGSPLTFSDPVEVELTRDMLTDPSVVAEDESITDPSVAAVLSALEAGQDPTDVLPPPAAGAAPGDEGHSFVRLSRIVESVSGTTFGGAAFAGFAQAFDTPDLLNQEEGDGEPVGEPSEGGPPVALPDAVSLDEDTSAVIFVLGNDRDPDGDLDPTSVRIVREPEHGTVSVDPGTGAVTYTPDPNYNGPDSFEYTVDDEEGNTSDPTPVDVTVNPVADPPLAEDDVATTDEDSAVVIDVLANDSDPDGDLDPTTVVITQQPEHGTVTVDPVTGEVTYTPDDNYNGPDSFEYTVQDAEGNTSNPATVNITVTPDGGPPPAEEGPPVAADDVASTDEDTSVVIDVVANDSDPDGDLDPTTVVITQQPDHGSVTIDPVTGAVTYTPDDNYNGPDSFLYTVQDAAGNTSNPATVSITVNPVGDPPVAENDQATTDEDTAVVIDVVANDSDPDGDLDPTTVVITQQPDHGSVTVDPVTGAVTYTPDENYNGPDSFQYTIQDEAGNTSNPATVNITVNPEGDPPVAEDDVATTDEDTAVVIDVVANDSDPDGDLDPTTVVITQQPDHGSVTVDLVTGAVTYTPDDNYNGPDSFQYTIQDEAGNTSDPATVNITVNPIEDPPVAEDDAATTDEDTAVVIDVVANDSDPDGDLDPTTVVITQQPDHGSVSVDPVTGAVTYTPDDNYNGSDSFQYTIQDEAGNTSDPATVNITVNPEGDPPVAKDDATNTDEDTAVVIDVVANDSDPDGDLDPTTVVITQQPDHGSVTVDPVTGAVTYTPDDNYNGPDSFQYTIQDEAGNTSDPATVNITVNPVEDPPVAEDDVATTDEDTAVVIDVVANDSDPDGDLDPTTVVITQQPDHGSVTVDPVTGAVTYTPDDNYNGPDNFQYTIQDEAGNTSNPATVNITVNPVNDPPEAVDDNANTEEGSAVTIDVLDNDSDPDGDPIEINSFTQPSNGTVVLNPDGSFTYTPSGEFVGEDSFTYTIRDSSGAISNTATVTITVSEDNPVELDMTNSVGTVYDVGLLSVQDTSESTNGSFKVTAPDGLASITIAGTLLTVAELNQATPVDPLTVINNGDEELVITAYDANTGVVSYSYSLINPVSHAVNRDQSSVSFEVIATDVDGDTSAPGFIMVTQIDDQPEIISVEDKSFINGVGQVMGAVVVDLSADEPHTFSWGDVTTDVRIFVHGFEITITTDDATRTASGRLADNTLVFKLTVNDDLSGYTFEQFMDIQNLNEGKDFDLSAMFTVTDEDQDSDTDTIDIAVGEEDDGGGNNGGGEGNEVRPNEEGYVLSTSGDDDMIGEPGTDIFQWHLNDGGPAGDPVRDVVNNFETGGPGADGDVLDLSDLLVSEESGDLTDYLHFKLTDSGDTVLEVSTTGGFASGFDEDAVEQVIFINDVDLVTAFTDVNDVVDQGALIQSLVNNGSLITDI